MQEVFMHTSELVSTIEYTEVSVMIINSIYAKSILDEVIGSATQFNPKFKTFYWV